jgi:hypothetical protein
LESDQCEISEEWLNLSTMPEKRQWKRASGISMNDFSAPCCCPDQITHSPVFDHFFATEIDMGSISAMINALIDGVITTLLQMKCDRRGPLAPRQKQHNDHIADESTSL